jgi:short-subunit dehydrogenase involved in D-alanine esterification of teichoic acids
MKLENRTVLITGGTSGIGLELAKQHSLKGGLSIAVRE